MLIPVELIVFEDAPPPVVEGLVTPVNAAAFSLRFCVPLPVSGEILSTIRNGWRLVVRYLVD